MATTNKEAPNTLISNSRYKVLDALCEGEIDSFVVRSGDYGANPLVSTYYDNVPVINPDGSSNYNTSGQGFQFSYTLGTSSQPALPGFDKVENIIPLSSSTRVALPPINQGAKKEVIASFNTELYPDADSIKVTVRVPSLMATNTEGNTNGYEIKYAVDIAVNGGSFQQNGDAITINGKCTQPYLKETLHTLPKPGTSSFYEWKVRVRRTTTNMLSIRIQNELFVEAISVVSNNTFNYPNTVLVGTEISADQFSNIPSRAYEVRGLKVKVPTGYTPTKYNADGSITPAVYPAVWDGTWASNSNTNLISNNEFSVWPDTNWTVQYATATKLTDAPPGSSGSYLKLLADGTHSELSISQTVSITAGKTYKISGFFLTSLINIDLKVCLGSGTEISTVQSGSTKWSFFEANIVAGSADSNIVFKAVNSTGEYLTINNYLMITSLSCKEQGVIWTNNPAWTFYDLVTNKRYGLGQYIQENLVDKWTLYQISQYCDEMVDDGEGGLEPRFTCNCFIQTRQDAYQLLQNFISIFQGMTYWAGGQIMTTQARDANSVQLFTNANVINGKFTYSDTARNTRSTVIKIKWINPDNFYKEQVEYVEDIDGIARYGYIEKEVTAFACTSRGQAIRAAKWVLTTERYMTETITFQVGLDGLYTKPGDIFSVYDNFRKNSQQGGRILGYDGSYNNIQIDREVYLRPGYTYQLYATTPKANVDITGVTGSSQIDLIRNIQVESRLVTNSAGTYATTLAVNSGFSSYLQKGSVWILHGSGSLNSLAIADQYRCLATSEVGQNVFEILGVEWNTGINYYVDTGYNSLPHPTNSGDFSAILPASNLESILTTGAFIDNTPFAYIQLNWDHSPSLNRHHYEVSGRNQPLAYTVLENPTANNYSFPITETGIYDFAVVAVSQGGVHSSSITDSLTVTSTDLFDVPMVPTAIYISGDAGDTRLIESIDGNIYPTGFLGQDLTIAWFMQTGQDGYESPRFAYVSGYNLTIKDPSTSAVLHTANIIGRENRSYPVSYSDMLGWSGGPRRMMKVEVSSYNKGGAISSPLVRTINNPAPSAGATPTLYGLTGLLSYSLKPASFDLVDISGVNFWYNSTNNIATATQTNTPALGGAISVPYTGTFYAWYSLIDTFGSVGSITGGPYTIGQNSTQGPIGDKIVDIYQRNYQTPAIPTAYSYPPNVSWYTSIPAGSDAVWLSQATMTSAGSIVNSAIGSPWSAPRRLSGNVSFYQTTPPTTPTYDLQIGDLWWDTDDNYRLSRWNGASWASAFAPFLTTGANGIITGMGVNTAGDPNKPFVILASGFQVWDGASAEVPFMVNGGKVYIRSGFVEDLTFGQIRGDTASANNLIVTSSVNGQGSIRSSNYTAGSAGWIISGNGYAEFANGMFRGSIDIGAGNTRTQINTNGLNMGNIKMTGLSSMSTLTVGYDMSYPVQIQGGIAAATVTVGNSSARNVLISEYNSSVWLNNNSYTGIFNINPSNYRTQIGSYSNTSMSLITANTERWTIGGTDGNLKSWGGYIAKITSDTWTVPLYDGSSPIAFKWINGSPHQLWASNGTDVIQIY